MIYWGFVYALWWPLHLDNWYLSLCIGYGGDSHAVPLLLEKVKYSVYMIYICFPLFINNIIIDCTSLVYRQLLLKVYFTGNKTVFIFQQIALVAYIIIWHYQYFLVVIMYIVCLYSILSIIVIAMPLVGP
jgi:hypothetical protein